MAKSLKEFLAAVAKDEQTPGYQARLAADMGDARDLNDPANPDGDVYYDEIDAEIDRQPIGALRIVRGG